MMSDYPYFKPDSTLVCGQVPRNDLLEDWLFAGTATVRQDNISGLSDLRCQKPVQTCLPVN